MKTRTMLAALSLLTAVALTAGCAGSRMTLAREFKLNKGAKVAVITFRNLSTLPKAGDIVADLFAAELYRSPGFVVLEPSEQMKVLADQGIVIDENVSPPNLPAIGKTLKVDYLLTGSVTEFRYRHNINEQPVVGLTARIIEVSGGKTVWAATRSETGPSLFPGVDALSMLAQRAVAAMVDTVRPEE